MKFRNKIKNTTCGVCFELYNNSSSVSQQYASKYFTAWIPLSQKTRQKRKTVSESLRISFYFRLVQQNYERMQSWKCWTFSASAGILMFAADNKILLCRNNIKKEKYLVFVKDPMQNIYIFPLKHERDIFFSYVSKTQDPKERCKICILALIRPNAR